MVLIRNGIPKPNIPINPNPTKKAAIFDCYVLVQFLNGWDYSYSCSYGPNHSDTKPSQIQTSKTSDFEWILNLNVPHFRPHCEHVLATAYIK